jgi:hypothetical protein
MAVKYFAHDDSPFESWLKEHPDGYVLNFYTTATGRCTRRAARAIRLLPGV